MQAVDNLKAGHNSDGIASAAAERLSEGDTTQMC